MGVAAHNRLGLVGFLQTGEVVLYLYMFWRVWYIFIT